MAKFEAGQMIVGKLTMSDGTEETKVFLVNRVLEHETYGEMYSLDNGDGFIDSRSQTSKIDATFEVAD